MKLHPIYKTLCDLPGVSGYEHHVRAFMRQELAKYSDEIVQDKIGSIFAIKRAKNPNAPIVMIAGHMDEVGLLVTGITETGALKISNMGGLGAEVLISQHVEVHTDKGVIAGIIGSVPPHIGGNEKLEVNQLLIDIGANDKDHAIALGIKPGNMATFKNFFTYTADKEKVISKAWDDRWGCGMALELLKDIQHDTFDVTLVIGATVQEEVGLRGATTSVNMIKPDVFIALDASPLNDVVKDPNAFGKLGEGFLLRMYDPRNIMHTGLREFFLSLTKKHKIPYQIYTSKGGTDAARALDLNEGTLATTIGLPCRYIHSTASMMSIKDHEAAKKMLRKVIKALTPEKIQELKENN